MGEDEIVRTFFAPLAADFPGALGLKDDCAVLTPPAGADLVLTTDAVAAGVHFLADDAAGDIAWKALAVNVSDLTAKGARPLAYLLSLAFPEAPTRAWLDGFATGLREAQSAFGIVLAGGDTDRRPGVPLSATVTAIGAVPQGRMVRRATARAGDLLFLSGTIGDAALGLLLRHDLGRAAAMDVSDGLVKDCARLARAAGLAASLDGARLPFSPAARTALGREPELFEAAVTGGDDNEVLAAVPPERAEAFRAAAAASGVPVAEIGRFAQGAGVVLTGPDGRPVEIGTAGWEHFP